MGTSQQSDGIAGALFGKGQRAVLEILFGRPEESVYFREIVRAADMGVGAMQRELKRLVQAGIVTRTRRGRQTFYQANPACPIFEELKALVRKTLLVADTIGGGLRRLHGKIDAAFVYGSMARGAESTLSDVDLMVVGSVTLAEVVAVLEGAQERTGREINPVVMSRGEFLRRRAAGDGFLKRVLSGEKIFVIGSDDDLAGLAQ